MAKLTGLLLGPPRFECDSKPIKIGRRKGIALLAYLAMTRQRHHRDALATLLWPSSSQSRARANLRHVLSELNQALDLPWLELEGETVSLNQELEFWLDVEQFRYQLAACQTHGHPTDDVCPACLPPLTEAVSLYRHDFLAGFTLRNSPEFDEWQFFQAESLRQELAVALERLVRGHSAQEQFEPAIEQARRWLALDPLHEPVQRQLMILYALAGQRAAALRQYAACERLLKEELGLHPDEETVQAYEAIKAKWVLPPPIGRVTPSRRKPSSQQQKANIASQPERFRLERKLGTGGMGEVWLATDTVLERQVALKRPGISPSSGGAEQLLQEARLLAKLNHPNITAVHDYFIDQRDNSFYLVMEYVEGKDLSKIIRQDTPLPLDIILEVTRGILQALSYAHQQGVVHRDVKPANVLIGADVKLTDFGLANLRSMLQRGTSFMAGTPAYMAPEQIEGRPTDGRADLYSLGVVLFELLSGGHLPFDHTDEDAMMEAHLHTPPPPLSPFVPDVSPALEQIIIRLLAKDPAERYPSAEAVLEIFGTYDRQEGETAAQLVEQEELGIAPTEETSALAEQVRAGVLAEPPSVPDKPQDTGSKPLPFLEQPAGSATDHMLSDKVLSDKVLFVAREEELNQLDSFLNLALSGRGRVAFVTGEAGSGKTSLVHEFTQRTQTTQPELVVAGGNCDAFTGVGDPYLPFREVLELLTGDVEARWASGTISREQARRLWTLIPHVVRTLVAEGPDLVDIFVSGPGLVQRAAVAASGSASWLSQLRQLVAHQEARPAPTHLGQTNLFEQYTNVLQVLARQQPLLLVIDDLQWADVGSLSLLFHLGRRLRGQRILLIGNYRPADVALGRDGERHPLEPVVNEFQRNFGQIQVDLNQTEGRAFIKALLDSEPHRLGASFQEALYNHARGHALFTVEMLHGMQVRGDLVQDGQGRWCEGPTLDWETLPARVEGAIGERIDRLPVGLQEILQVASVEGEGFTAEVVARVQGIDESEVVRQLSGSLDKQHRLIRNQSSRLMVVGGQRLSRYRFRHILFQRYLYHSLDEAERVYLHQAVGQVLEQLYQGQCEEVAVELAWHFQLAGLVVQAVAYLQQAGDRAARLSAYQEAIAHYIRALELLETLPDVAPYAKHELNLQLALGRAQIITKGSAAPEVERTFSRARELGQQLEDIPLLLIALGGLRTNYAIRGDISQAYELAEQMWQLAQDLADPSLIIGAHIAMGIASLYLGDLSQAQTHFEQAFALYQPQQSADLISGSGQGLDPGVLAQRLLALVKWLQGYPEQALVLVRQALTLAEELDHPFSIAGVLGITCEIHLYRREGQAVKEWAEKMLALATKHGFVLWKLGGSMYRGWALVEQRQAEEGIEQIRQGLNAYAATGARSAMPFRTLLVNAHLRIGQVAEGLGILEKVLSAVEQTGERYPEAELYRLKGELLRLGDADDGEIEQQFLKAIDIARRQGAKSWELRATVSLCRLWQAQGKKEEARQMLADIYGWFTEGFDTVDLKEAKALLEKLA